MTYSEPDRQWQDELYQKLENNNPVAFAELCQQALPHLVSFLQAQYPQQEQHNFETVSIDTLLKFRTTLEKYHPEKMSLFAYLRMDARGDMLNLIDKNRRIDQRLVDVDAPSLSLPQLESVESHFALDEWLQEHTELSRQELLEKLEAKLSHDEQQILLLMLDGVRSTKNYAAILNITEQDESVQRKEVKRAKDRLIKKLRRFGKEIGKK